MAGTTRFRRDLAPTAELTARGISLRGETEEDFPFLEHLLGFREKALNGPYWLMDREPHPSERTCPK
jgi:hypothetical protein